MKTLFLVLVLTPMLTVSGYERCLGSCPTCYGPPMNFVCTSCYDGKFLSREGAYYACVRCYRGCVTCTGYGRCQTCHPGRYGTGCGSHCSDGCLNNTCEQKTGSCLCKEHFTGATCQECTPGRYGTNCQLHCDASCFYKTCYKDTGECFCPDGFTGLNCSQCITGRYGPSCQLKCSNGCKGGICDRKTGQCVCKPDYIGKKCEKCAIGTYYANATCNNKCPSNCPSCKSVHYCLECKLGYYGSSCQWSCSTGCLHGRCDKRSGYCQNRECKPGFKGAYCNYCVAQGKHGDDCSLDCVKNCLKCSSRSICAKCKKGFWGARCRT